MNNPSTKSIDISTLEGLELLKIKAKFYGHYAEQLKVLELIQEIINLRFDPLDAINELARKTAW